MDVEYIKENLNQDPRWVNKLFREACARFLDASPIAEKITVEIERKGTRIYMKVNGTEIDDDGSPSTTTLFAGEPVDCRGCGRKITQRTIKREKLTCCPNCGVNI